jgi:hypothetical protein
MKIIISESQLRQIIESKEERNLLEVDVEYLLNNIRLVMRALKKGVDGIVVICIPLIWKMIMLMIY